MTKAIGMFSGGLDSLLAIKLIKDQGIDVDVLHYNIGFESLRLDRQIKHKAAEIDRADIERKLGITIQEIDVTEPFLQVVLHPKHGYGSEMNPCIDCKIFILQQAKAYMETHQAQFIFTGEVVGQRPMSQMLHTMHLIEQRSGLRGYLLRPLSAKILEPTLPEQQGLVDRERLLGISGRGRHEQLALARQYGLNFQQPAGGCLLNDPSFSSRLKELLAHTPEPLLTTTDVMLLKLGRHLRLADNLKIIVGRHEVDNDYLAQYAAGRWTAAVRDIPGPTVVIDGEPDDAQFEQIAQITVNYTKAKDADRVIVDFLRGSEQRAITITPDALLNPNQWRIGE